MDSDKEKLTCELCQKEFVTAFSRNRHLKKFHQKIMENDKNQHILCPICPEEEKLSSHNNLIKYLNQTQEVNCKELILHFRNIEKFETWRKLENREVDYACQRKNKTPNGDELIYYSCNRSNTTGYISNYQKRNIKTGGSIKIRGICPSRIAVKIFNEEFFVWADTDIFIQLPKLNPHQCLFAFLMDITETNDHKMEPGIEPKEEDIIIVKLGLTVGDKFSSFKAWQTKLDEASAANFVRFWKRDSRTIETARRKVRRPLKSDLEFYQLRYSCFFAQKPRTRPTLGKRKRRSLAGDMEYPCPASISMRVTEDGNYLEIYNICEQHNHSVNEHEYKKLIPKKKIMETLLGDDDGFDDPLNHDERYKLVVKKCKHISRIAAVSNPARLVEIIKNLDDYIFYLKYTQTKEEVDRIKKERMNISNEIDRTVAADESISIIVEEDEMDMIDLGK